MIRPGALGVLLALLAAPAGAQGVSALRGHDSNAPIDISSDRIEVQDRADRAIWVGNVHVVQGDMVMDSARMTVAYSKATTPGANPQIKRIDASGNVTVVSRTERARGNFGIYDLDKRVITLIGGVVLTRAGNTVSGARMVIDLDSGRATVDGNAVGGGSTGSSAGGRVTGRFSVPNRTAPATTPPGGTQQPD